MNSKKPSKKMLAPLLLTEEQMKWIESEVARTGNSIASTVRGVIQSNIENTKKDK